MASSITWLGHSAFQLQTAGKTILIDPFLTGNPSATVSAEDIYADFIIVSHGHEDHIGDTIAIAKRTGAVVISNFEIIQWLQGQGVQNAHPMHIGGSHKFDFGTVKLTIAHHGSCLPDGSNGGNPTGVILKLDTGNVYFAGDTGLFYDMKLIGEEDIALAILPVGDNFTMGPEDSIRAIKLLDPGAVMPMHYDTWPLIGVDIAEWSKTVAAETSSQAIVPDIGVAIELE